MKKLSIIIVTYKSEHDIYDCLASVRRYSDLPKDQLEIIIVDNSSECEPMFTHLKQLYGSDIVLIHNTHNGGYGQGNNVGIRIATAPVILIMNPDVRMMEPVFQTAINAFDADSRLCMYGMSQMLSSSIKSQNSFIPTDRCNGYVMTLLNGLCSRLGVYLPRLMYLSGSCFFVRKSMFETIGLFDENNFMYGEEADIHYRFGKRYGYHITFNPSLHYIHLTMEREVTLDYLKKTLDVACRINEKNGYARRNTIRNRMQSNRVKLIREWWREKFNNHNRKMFNVYRDYDNYLHQLLLEQR